MKKIQQDIIEKMNEWGAIGKPFAFIIDFNFEKPLVFEIDDAAEILWKTPDRSNYIQPEIQKKQVIWNVSPVKPQRYRQAFEKVQHYIHNGDTYLLNLTMPTQVVTNLSSEEIFHLSSAPYKIWLKNEFVCFSPEIFVRISDGIISSYPMKGTIDACIENAEQLLLSDRKEVAEHHTIVDLIRNDLSMVANEIEVEQLMYIDRIHTNKGDLFQMSSKISGKLPANYPQSIGSILAKMLPAGSICGAPKPKTLEVIGEAESYERGYYTGIFGVFDGANLDSCVLIRYMEQEDDKFTFKSGGGITFLSDCETEYNELIRKVYVPIS